MRSYAHAVHMPQLDGSIDGGRTTSHVWIDQAVILRGRPNSFNSVRRLDGHLSVRLDEATLYFVRKGRGMLLSTEGALHVSIDCDNATRSGHLEF